MNINMCNMIYVKDVNLVVSFWKNVGFVEISREVIMDSETVILAPTTNSNARLQFWDIEFIRQVSPEVAEMKPSMLFTVDNLKEWHQTLLELTDTTSKIMDNAGKGAFNFADPEGNYYAFGEN